jgi:predicted aspartyl protease
VKIALPGEQPEQPGRIALINTGADGTFVPTPIIERIGVPIVYMTNARSHLGERLLRVPVHIVDIILFDEIRLPSVEVIADDWGNHILIGRNILNKLHIELDGPNEVTMVTG